MVGRDRVLDGSGRASHGVAHAPDTGRVVADGPRRRHRWLGFGFVALLSFLGGMTDAIGFLRAGDFLSFMSGNTTRLAIAVGKDHGSDVGRLAAILAIFVAGNAVGVVVVRCTGERQWPLLMLVAIVTGLVAGFVGAAPSPWSYLPLVFAMGMLNAAVDNVAGHPIGLTYVTGALSRFGKGLGRFLCGDLRLGFLAQMFPWIGMLAGAVTGVFLLQAFQEAAIWAIGGLAVILTLISLAVPRSWMRHSFGLG
ncbi:YoaK family protein [Jiella avicenniae]|uniref:DUF1275 domain-containing protein n=1 Tax=Jiella avicenniae TaxID=2907202 RepID=A0A9X1P2Y1_9HYPH|nr:YoaK family protein [Jiella avicenniae]MCE7029251.1 DUF1275 domain-containing protein [Jiella avicenniae]